VLEHVWAWKEKQGDTIIQQLKKLGCSCDWTRERFTMDPEYSRCVQKVFVELYRKGLIYRGRRMVNWDPAARTALSDEEVEMLEEQGHLWHLKYPLLDEQGQPKADEFVVVATTRPETMLGDEAVAVNPSDPRYRHLVGRRCRLPLQHKPIPIIADDLVDPQFGTGCVKVTPAHDPNDYQIAARHHLPLTVVIGPDGAMTRAAGEDFAGLDRLAARQAVLEALTAQGLLLKTEDYVHNIGYSQRSHVAVEPCLSEQWFLKYPSVERARACVELPEDERAAGGKSPEAHPEGKSACRPEPGAPETIGANSLAPLLHVSESAAGQPTPTARPTMSPSLSEANSPAQRMRFHPDRWAKVYDHWMGRIQDWCISRQLWWGHRIPVWYSEGWGKLGRRLVRVSLTGQELEGANLKELRLAAMRFARERGVLGQDFLNLDTGQAITVQEGSLDHGFSNSGVAKVKLVPALPELLRHALRVSSEPHLPASQDVLGQEAYFSALQLGDQLFGVQFRVKVCRRNFRLYDHQTVRLWRQKQSEPDGDKSPEAQAPKGQTSRPASGSGIILADLLEDVNHDTAFVRCQIETPGEGWRQDPDVLDTWFSSWLWPFAAMGWPEQTETLKKFYPTTDLVTGPDIIFFWVARMIMAGYEFMGEPPFRNVYFTGIIRDKLGRKMSKSLGNSPDPLALIAQYGADALRFGTMRSAPLGQDVLFDEKDVELGRNFCNKLWNACRFRQMQGGQVQGQIEPALLTSDDKWILLKLDQAIREITSAFAHYRFNEATQTLYRFFWSEYCDWYVEASKALLARPGHAPAPQNVEPQSAATLQRFNALTPPAHARRANTLAVLDFVLSHTLRLFHPFLPFITEELWHGLGYQEDMPENQGGQTIMYAPWPKPLDEHFRQHYGLDDQCLAAGNAKYDLVTQGRHLRRQAHIPPGKKIRFVFKAAQAVAPHDADVLKLLLHAEALELNPAYQPRKGAPAVHSELGELYLPLEDQVDPGAEQARLAKELEKSEGEIAKVQQKLNNPDFTAKAPPRVLQEHRQRLAQWQAKRERAKRALEALKP